VKLFKVSNSILKEVGRTNFKLEKEIQLLIEKNLKAVFNLEFIASEVEVKLGAEKFRMDTLGFNKETKSFVIIEYKKVRDYSVVDQGYTYLSALINNKSDFVLKYINKTKTNLFLQLLARIKRIVSTSEMYHLSYGKSKSMKMDISR